jgi:hypothetical protein
MTKQAITIQSKGRPNVIQERTLKFLHNRDDVYIVVEPQDYLKYSKIENVNIIKLPKNDLGLTYSRKYTQEYFADSVRYVWMLDDNIDQFITRKGLTDGGHPKLRPIEEQEITVKKIFDEVLQVMIDNNYIQMTLSFRPTNWLQKGLIKENTRSWGIVLNDNKKMLDNKIMYDLECKLFQDMDMVAQILKKGFKNACYYQYAFHKRMTGYSGGCNTYRTVELSLDVCKYLVQKYGNAVCYKFHDGHGIWEPKFNWKKLVNQPTFKKLWEYG